jgi:Cu/Ag efflux protein CusF
VRLWRAIVLMSLALVVGLVLGYARWGLEARRLREAATLSPEERQRSTEPQRSTARGIVRMLLRDQGVVFLTHEAIPGVMAGATRAFQASSPRLLASLAPGDPVRFTLERRGMGHLLVEIEKVD